MSFNVIIMDDLNSRTGDNSDIIPKIRYFCVGQHNHLSDHAFIIPSIKTNNSSNLDN